MNPKKELLNTVISEGMDAIGRFAGNKLLGYLGKVKTKGEGSKATAEIADDFIKAGMSDNRVRKRASKEGVIPRFGKEDLPEGFGVRTALGSVMDNPVETSLFARKTAAPAAFAGIAAAGTLLNSMFGGKPSSEYKVPVSPMTAYGNAMGMNQNVISSNVSTMNAEYIENLKYQHQLDLIRAKAEARTPGVQMVDPSGRPALNEEVKEVARMLYGTGLKL